MNGYLQAHYDQQQAEIAKYLEGIVGVVEATRFEKHALWREYHYQPREGFARYEWKDTGGGYFITVGHVVESPVCISIETSTVNGHKLLFWHATSQMVDHVMIDNWLKDNLPQSARQAHNPQYLNQSDPTNFHNVFPREVAA